jgi:hypothetical protein
MLERTSERPVGPGPRCAERRKSTRLRVGTEVPRGESKEPGPGRRCRPRQIIGLGAAPAGRIGSDGDATTSSGARPNALCRVQTRIRRNTTDATTTDHVDPNCPVVVPGCVRRPSGRSEVCDERYEDSSFQLSRPSGCSGVTALCLTKSILSGVSRRCGTALILEREGWGAMSARAPRIECVELNRGSSAYGDGMGGVVLKGRDRRRELRDAGGSGACGRR